MAVTTAAIHTMTHEVVIVDDNPKFLAVLQEFLGEYEGIQVIAATDSGHEAIELVGARQPALMIVDLWMPDMGGLELTRQVKARWPETPIIILTLFDSERHREAALEAGANAFVTKGRMDADLMPAVERLLDGAT